MKYIYSILSLLFFFNCSTTKEGVKMKNAVWGDLNIEYLDHFTFIPAEENGLLTYGSDSIWISNHKMAHPESPYESYFNSFYAYHYNGFLDKVYIDSKVKKIFRDSVEIVSVEPIKKKDGYTEKCPSCNFLATLKFKDGLFYEPIQMNASMIDFYDKWDTDIESEKGGYTLELKNSREIFNIIRKGSSTTILRAHKSAAAALSKIKITQGTDEYEK